MPSLTASPGGRLPYYVAAVNASDEAKALSDYVCDGTADEVQIQQAVDAATASTLGKGTVVLSEGTFTFAGSVWCDVPISVRGQGPSSTRMTGPSSQKCFEFGATGFGGVSISGIYFDGFNTSLGFYDDGGEGLHLSDCIFENAVYAVLATRLEDAKIIGCQFYDNEYGIFVEELIYRSSIIGNGFFASTVMDMRLVEPAGVCVIADNTSQFSAAFLHSFGAHTGVSIVGNMVTCGAAGSPDAPAIRLSGDNPNDALTWGINHVTLSGNTILAPDASPGAIHIVPTASSDDSYPLLTGNKVVGAVYLEGVCEVLGNSFINGLYVADGAAGSRVSNNVLGDSALWGSAVTYTLNEETPGNAVVGAGNYLDGTWT